MAADLAYKTVAFSKARSHFSNVTRDSDGNYYYLTYDSGEDPEVYLVKVDSNGAELVSSRQDTSSSVLNISEITTLWDSMRLHYADGRLCAVYMRRMGNGHQGSIIVTYASSNLRLLRNYGQNASHSFDSRIAHDGTDFLNISLGDNGPRGLKLDRVMATRKSGRTVYTYKTKHFESGRASNDIRTYTELGGVVPTKSGIGVLFASEPSTDNSLATGAINESRNIGYLLVAERFNEISQADLIVPPQMVLTAGRNSPLFGYYTFGGRYVQQLNRGIRWFTRYRNLELDNATRPKLLSLSDNRLIVLWEKWTPERHVSTHGALINELGEFQTEPTTITEFRLSDGDDLARFQGRVYAVTASGKSLDWMVLDTQRPLLSTIRILRHDFDQVLDRVFFEFEATPGRSYALETSLTLSGGDWVRVSGSKDTARGSIFSLSGTVLDREKQQYWRVVELD